MANLEDYACWRAALAGESTERFAKQPHCGFWRRGKSGDPVAIWRAPEGDKLVARVGGKTAQWADAEFDETVFGFCLPNPISHETYTAVMRGEPWPGTDAVVAEQTSPGAGDNSQGVDEADTLRDQIAAAVKQAQGYGAVADDETAAKAQSLRARLVELRGEVETRHRSEKEPFLEGGRAVDRKWFPLRDDADAAAKTIRDALSKHETEKARLEAEQLRKRNVAQVISGAPQKPPPAPAKPAPIRGGYGKAAAVRIIRVALVVDQDAVYRTFRENPDVCALLKKLAQKAVEVGATVPGIEIEEQRRVA